MQGLSITSSERIPRIPSDALGQTAEGRRLRRRRGPGGRLTSRLTACAAEGEVIDRVDRLREATMHVQRFPATAPEVSSRWNAALPGGHGERQR